MQSSNKLLSIFRKIAFIEGISFLLIGVTMYLKYQMAMPKPNYIVGMAHGVLFITYCVLLAWLFFRDKWKFSEGFFGFVASLIPFGTFVADKYIFSKK
ncbi:MAG: integral membrane protein [Spirosomataceae bacterium]|jgi:integral membrane protein